ncbi:hypothetical protein GCM10009665_72050 [Kitasatospora nipponensis]|uniref:Histone H1-like nucleoprotein HC2 n=1 Tax=Kitasatospora nipponensis TaxID=258049 RepID=A0ABN1WZB9_9ACTN
MAQTLREYMELAAGLAQEAGKRALGTAAELLERSGVDLAAVERTVTAQLPSSVQSLPTTARELVTVGLGGLDLAVGLARAEAEKTFERFGRLGDQVVKVGVVLSYLEGKLRDLEDDGSAAEDSGAAARPGPPQPRADALFGEDWQPEQEPVTGFAGGFDAEPDAGFDTGFDAGFDAGPDAGFDLDRTAGSQAPLVPEPRVASTPRPARKAPAAPRKAAPRKSTAGKAGAGESPAAGAPTKKAAARKTATKKVAAKTASEPKTPAKKAPAKKAPAKTAPAKKAPAKQADPGQGTATKAAAKKATAKKSPAATAKKAAPRRSAAKAPAPESAPGASDV